MNLDKILGIKYPVIQGGMANISDGAFAAEVSNNGALGLIGGGGMTPEDLRREIHICKGLTDKIFGVNLMILHPDIEELAQVLVEEGIGVVTTGAGNPSKYIARWKKAGIKVFPVVSSLSLALRMEKLGVDGVIAEGSEAGGHIGEMTTMTLLSIISSKLTIPVIAAGGIANGRQMLAAKILGAAGVQMGTRFLATEECKIHENYKEKIIMARENHIVVIGRSAGLPIRLIRNSMTNEYLKLEAEGVDKLDLEKFTLGSLKRAVDLGDVKEGSLMAGLVAAEINDILPIAKMLEGLISQYQMELERLYV